MKKIKIIDLLNKIANGEEVSKKIKYNDEIFYFTSYDSGSKNYLSKNYELLEILDIWELNDELEILDNEDVEELDIIIDEATPNSYYILNEHGTKCYLTKHSKVIADKVNELVRELNKLKKGNHE